jgi:hypothetical protein
MVVVEHIVVVAEAVVAVIQEAGITTAAPVEQEVNEIGIHHLGII